jgi:hypothetical protein
LVKTHGFKRLYSWFDEYSRILICFNNSLLNSLDRNLIVGVLFLCIPLKIYFCRNNNTQQWNTITTITFLFRTEIGLPNEVKFTISMTLLVMVAWTGFRHLMWFCQRDSILEVKFESNTALNSLELTAVVRG